MVLGDVCGLCVNVRWWCGCEVVVLNGLDWIWIFVLDWCCWIGVVVI